MVSGHLCMIERIVFEKNEILENLVCHSISKTIEFRRSWGRLTVL